MDIDTRSNLIFGRYDALRLCAAIARLAKPEFTTGELAALTEISSSQCSKELGRLKQADLVRAVSKRGDYVRLESSFWELVDRLATECDE